jgi:hypothetical protein
MNFDLVIGLTLLAIFAVLLFVGLPKGGVSPRFLQFDVAMVIYPPFLMIFLVSGLAELITGLLSAPR